MKVAELYTTSFQTRTKITDFTVQTRVSRFLQHLEHNLNACHLLPREVGLMVPGFHTRTPKKPPRALPPNLMTDPTNSSGHGWCAGNPQSKCLCPWRETAPHTDTFSAMPVALDHAKTGRLRGCVQ
jgi:hypothetical protein